ncbi:MAG: hypothetical protein V4478_03395 [Patescibacteria group bacterium]
MNTYSATQQSNLVAIAGVIALILNHFHINIGSDDIMLLLGSGLAVIGVVTNWVHRYQKGDLTLGGFRKGY